MNMDSFKRKLKIVGVEEAQRLSRAELAGWNILSIRGRSQEPLSFPGSSLTKSLHFDDVEAVCSISDKLEVLEHQDLTHIR